MMEGLIIIGIILIFSIAIILISPYEGDEETEEED